MAVLMLLAPAAGAQSIESVLSPGKLSKSHAKWDDDCAKCHVRFDRGAQERRCMDCHKDVGADVAAKTGFHGKLRPQACRSCHTEHKGPDAHIVALDTQRFDHSQTDFALRGAHQKTACASCHTSGKKYRDAPAQCDACHRKADVHKGALGADCASCHNETRWKQARFDHAATRFPLTGRHADATCASCHVAGQYKETPRACVACHRNDDTQRGHKGQFGERCETCHGTLRWKPSVFNHDTDTRYTLRGKHRAARCADCHTAPLYKAQVSQLCYDCHRKDDKHKESLGRECASCHSERDWKDRGRFDHDKTAFPLVGKHVAADCKSCHKSSAFKEVGRECIACHKKDDRHAATLGEKCADCHQERDWKARFDHDRTRFQLRNAHARAQLPCTSCHKDQRSFRGTQMACVSCHQKDDRHEGQQGRQCEQCHTDRDWRAARVDHARTRFPLVGRHLAVECKSCHTTARFKDAPRECSACHAKDDRHQLKFGPRCESCHNARAWAVWDYDHDKRTRFKLEGAHVKVGCERCHQRPAPASKAVAELDGSCLACHRKDDTHDGNFGAGCGQCHTSDRWKPIRARGNLVRPTTQGANP